MSFFLFHMLYVYGPICKYFCFSVCMVVPPNVIPLVYGSAVQDLAITEVTIGLALGCLKMEIYFYTLE